MKRECLECGQPFEPRNRDQHCCSKACRNAFDNRRGERGRALYDLFMPLRYEREAATKEKAWSLMTAMAADWRAQDQRQRQGRRSWTPLKRQQDRLLPYRAMVVNRNAAGVRR